MVRHVNATCYFFVVARKEINKEKCHALAKIYAKNHGINKKNQKVIFECLFPQKNLSIIKNSVSISRNANAC